VNIRRSIAVVWLLLPAPLFAQGTFAVRFDQPLYLVNPSGTFQVSAVIDPVPPGGLFSYGVELIFEPAQVQVASERAIIVPGELDFRGPQGLGALKVTGEGMAAVKGSVDPAVLPPQPYTGSALASFALTDVSGAVGQSYQLQFRLYRTLGPTETVFVSGTGQPLDSDLAFGSANVEVVPEPSLLVLIMPAGWLLSRRRSRAFSLCGRRAERRLPFAISYP
jgi:hypothetical protein